jgi:uncharacterized repeat protein (TIGR03803 family)
MRRSAGSRLSFRVASKLMKSTPLMVMGCLVLPLLLASESRAQTVDVVYSFDGSNASQGPEGTPAQGRDGKLYGTAYGLTSGAIFRLATNGPLNQLFALNGTDGANPSSGVTLASDGNFYGTTMFGGSAGVGVLFKLTPGGNYTILHEFAGGADGAYPEGSPLQASDGNLYGTTHGLPGSCTVYKYSKLGIYSVLATLASTDGSGLEGPLLQGSDGNLYGTASQGGANGFGTIFKMTTTGTVISHYSFTGHGDGAAPIGGLIQGTDGNFYGMAGGGGKYTFGTIFKITPKVAFSTLYSFQGGPGDGAFPGSGLVQGTDGNLYGATVSGGIDGYGTVFQVSTSGAYRLLYSFQAATGEVPLTALLQDTSGKFYGSAGGGGANGYGTIFSLDMGLGPFVTFVVPVGRAGQAAQILGQGLTGTTSVTFNGVAATSFKVLADTYMTAVVPSGATTGPVVVTTPTGSLKGNKNLRIIGGTASTARAKSGQPSSRSAKKTN